MTRVEIQLDDNVKKEADAILINLGLDIHSAVNLFINRLVKEGVFPYETKKINNKRKENLEFLIKYASENAMLGENFKFNRNEIYER